MIYYSIRTPSDPHCFEMWNQSNDAGVAKFKSRRSCLSKWGPTVSSSLLLEQIAVWRMYNLTRRNMHVSGGIDLAWVGIAT